MTAPMRLLLVRHATTRDTRHAAFPRTCGSSETPGCEPLDAAGVVAATALRRHLPDADRAWASFALRAVQTAEHAGFAVDRDADLAECDFGRWSGQLPGDVDAGGLTTWYDDPASAPHDGESFDDVRRRATRVLARAAGAGGTTVAFTHGGLVKAAVCEVLELPTTAVWHVDVAPASVTELHATSGAWRVVRLNWTPALGARVGSAA